jgi:hypothetical protein
MTQTTANNPVPKIYDVTHIYGTGPFRKYGARRILVSPSINGWIHKTSKLWTPDAILHDLFVMGEFPWRGQRKFGKLPFADPALMNRMEALQSNNPRLRLFCGVFPRLKGQDCKQVLWWVPLSGKSILFGTENEVPLLDGTLEREGEGLPDPHAGTSWTGLVLNQA